jgi:hypothetical protein
MPTGSLGLEGMVSKRLGSRYRSGRSPDWLKFKNPDAPAGNGRRRKIGDGRGDANRARRRPRNTRNMGAMMVMETDHETAWHTWDYRWCRVIDCGALLASMVAKERVALA